MTDVAGRTAFITGGGNGIGLGIARAFARAGARIALADRDAEGLARAKAELSATTEVETVALDVRDRDGYARAADAVEAKLGPVSLLCNNAGVSGGAPAAKLSYELWDWSLGINLGGVVNGMTTFMPRMIERGGGGHIVNTASGAGLAGTSSGALYCTGKFAIVGMSEALRAELQPTDIGVSVLCPGPVATEIIARSDGDKPGAGAGAELTGEQQRAAAARAAQVCAGAELTGEQQRAAADRAAQMSAFLAAGRTPDEVGEMVLAAVRENRLYIHTDRIMLPALEARQQELLAAMPPED